MPIKKVDGGAEPTTCAVSTRLNRHAHAWSEAPPQGDGLVLPRSWADTVLGAGVILGCSVAVALVVGVAGSAVTYHYADEAAALVTVHAAPPTSGYGNMPENIPAPAPVPAPSPPPEPTVTVTVPPPSPAPPPEPDPRDADRIFREGMSGIPGTRVVNWEVAEAGGRSVCDGFASGLSRSQVVDDVQRNDPTFEPWQTSGVINVALAAYCPQYENAR